MNILVVEDDHSIAQVIHQGLSEAGYVVDLVPDGRQGINYSTSADYDAIVLDVFLPKISGLNVLKNLREQGFQTPVLLLTAGDTVEVRARGMKAGADDYLTKPFDFTELLARLSALLRPSLLPMDSVLTVGDLEMDTMQRSVRYGDRLIDLNSREYSLLKYLMCNPNQVLSRAQIAQHVQNFDFYGDYKVIDVYIGYLRRKLDRDSSHSLIHTIRDVGYCMTHDRD